MHQRQPRIRTLIALVALTVAVSAATNAVADDLFPDVPDSGFHDQIGNIANAGCASGFNDGTFRPQAATTRGQFAAWMNRCGGRTTDVINDNINLTTSGAGAAQVVGSVALTAGATGDLATGGFATVSGAVRARTSNPALCPCFVQAQVWDVVAGEEVGPPQFSAIPAGTTELNGENFTTIPVQAVVEMAPDSTRTFGVKIHFVDANVGTINVSTHLSAQYFPFGPTGTDQLIPVS